MQLRTVGDALIYLGAVAAAVTALGILMRYLVVRPLKSWIATAAKPAQQALEQLQPNVGTTQDSTRHLIEQTAVSTEQLVGRVEELAKLSEENRELATTALTLARETSDRLDRHLTGHLNGIGV